MSTFGKSQSASDVVRKLYTGVENFKVIALNPTKAEIEAIYGREIDYNPEYLSETEIEENGVKKKYKQVKFDFFLENEDKSISTRLQFYVADTYKQSATTGTYQVVNIFGKSTWLSKEIIQSKQLPDNMSFFDPEGLRIAKRGEVELVDALVALLNLKAFKGTGDRSDSYAQIPDDVWKNMFEKGDFSFIQGIVKGSENKIGVLLGVKTKDDGGKVQATFQKKVLRQFVLKQTKPDRFSYLLREVKSSQDNGAFSTVDFGPEDLNLREYNPSSTTSSDPNQMDVFGAEAVTASADDDWMNADV